MVWKALSPLVVVAFSGRRLRKSIRVRVKVGTALRRLGWTSELVAFALATLPVLELREAIPVEHWMQIDPQSVLGFAASLWPISQFFPNLTEI